MMTKVKIMRFCVCNCTTVCNAGDENTTWFKNKQDEVSSVTEIEKIVNEFIRDKNVIDIKVNTVDVHYHNNARSNTIDLIYTIVYKSADCYDEEN